MRNVRRGRGERGGRVGGREAGEEEGEGKERELLTAALKY